MHCLCSHLTCATNRLVREVGYGDFCVKVLTDHPGKALYIQRKKSIYIYFFSFFISNGSSCLSRPWLRHKAGALSPLLIFPAPLSSPRKHRQGWCVRAHVWGKACTLVHGECLAACTFSSFTVTKHLQKHSLQGKNALVQHAAAYACLKLLLGLQCILWKVISFQRDQFNWGYVCSGSGPCFTHTTYGRVWNVFFFFFLSSCEGWSLHFLFSVTNEVTAEIE